MRIDLRRSPLRFWSIVLTASAVLGLLVARVVARAELRAHDLGGLREVPVAAHPIAAGEALGSDDISRRRLPIAALPDGEIAADPVGQRTAVAILGGEVLLQAKLAPANRVGLAAALPDGRHAVAVPTTSGALALRPGNHVDVLATFDVDGTSEAPTFAVATDAPVLEVTHDVVTIAVLGEETNRVAFALARGTVTLALVR